MKKLRKIVFRTLLILTLLAGTLTGCGFMYIHNQMSTEGTSYTEAMEDTILSLVPEDGITIHGRTYGYWSVKSFLDEIRNNPYNYVHKNHTCILQYASEQEIYMIVTALRTILGC